MSGPVDKKDQGKAPMSFLYVLQEELGEVAKVLDFGNEKYIDLNNFKHMKDGKRRMIDAMIRHGWKAMLSVLDPESGRSHLAHAACCALMALWHERRAAELPMIEPVRIPRQAVVGTLDGLPRSIGQRDYRKTIEDPVLDSDGLPINDFLEGKLGPV